MNTLNELTTETNAGKLTVAGTTTSPATNVTVNTSNALLYADATFASTNQPWVNGNNTFTAIAKDASGRVDTNVSTCYFPATNTYSYDLNGNLLSDGTRYFTYDDENELTSVTVSNVWQSAFAYDGKMRRRIEQDYTWNGSAWTETNEIHFIYDGNVVIQERDINNLPQVTYTRGNDLSGTLQGAGGIGGLLARTSNYQFLASDPFAHAYYHADGNGNVTCLIYPSQQIAAKYLYDPFGNTLSMSEPLAGANRYRFSSKEWNENAGLYYYLYRFYDPHLQRWPNRDPLMDAASVTHNYIPKKISSWLDFFEEQVEPNGYEFVDNDPIVNCDLRGLACRCDHADDRNLNDCLNCAEINDRLNKAGAAINVGIEAAATSYPETPAGIVHDIINIASLDSASQKNLYRGALAKAFLNCINKWGGEDAQQIARNEYNSFEHIK